MHSKYFVFKRVNFILLGIMLVLLMCVTTPVFADSLDNWQYIDTGDINYSGIAYGNNTFVAVGDGGISTSNDGITWSNHVAGVRYFSGVAYGNGVFVVVGDGDCFTSVDGLVWTQSPTLSAISCITYGNGKFVATRNGPIFYTSTDGINWSSCVIDNHYYIEGITFGNGLFVAGGNSSGPTYAQIFTSTDGDSWKRVTLGAYIGGIKEVGYGNGTFIAVGENDTNTSGTNRDLILTSTDGVNWGNSSMGIPTFLYGVTYGNGTFVAVGVDVWPVYCEGSTILTSSDGTTWTKIATASKNALRAVAYGNNSFVTVGDGGTILRSNATVSLPDPTTISVTKATYGTAEDIIINWTPSSYASNYGLSVWKAPYFNDQYLLFDQYVTGSSMDIGKLPVGNYAVNMKPYNSLGGGPESNIVYFSVIPSPGNTTIIMNSSYYVQDNVIIKWTNSKNATSYSVSLHNNSNYSLLTNNIAGTSLNVGKLPAGDYQVIITPYNSTVAGQVTTSNFSVNQYVAELTVFADPDGDLGAHAWITIKNIGASEISVGKISNVMPNKMVSVGTWSLEYLTNLDWDKLGIWYNREALSAANGQSPSRVSLTMKLDSSQLKAVNNIINNKWNDRWTLEVNCSYFAIFVWNSVSSIQLNGQYNALTYDTPGELAWDIETKSGWESNKSITFDYPVYYVNKGKLILSSN